MPCCCLPPLGGCPSGRMCPGHYWHGNGPWRAASLALLAGRRIAWIAASSGSVARHAAPAEQPRHCARLRLCRRAAALAETYDSLERRIAELSAAEDLARVRPDLDGNAIMAILGIPPGREVGQAWAHLKELRLERGPLAPEQAEAELRAGWAQRDDT